MPKNAGHGQSAILSDSDYSKIFKQVTNPKHKLFIQIAKYTGERWGAITQLRVSDVYSDAARRVPCSHITFRAATRKADPSGKRETRQVPICDALKTILCAYAVPASGWLFPNRLDESQHYSLKNADNFFRAALERAGLDNEGISTHSTRRTMITKLAQSGIGVTTIQCITGHHSLAALQRYIQISDEQVKQALSLV
jgi:integrase/recombinase XerD